MRSLKRVLGVLNAVVVGIASEMPLQLQAGSCSRIHNSSEFISTISQINAGSCTPPMVISASDSPILLGAVPAALTYAGTVQLQSSSPGTSVTINGNGIAGDLLSTVTANTTISLSADMILTNGTVSVGPGTFQFNNAQNWTSFVTSSGMTIYQGGTIEFSTAGGTMATPMTLPTSATGVLDVDSGLVVTYSGTIVGAGSLSKQGTGSLVLSGANTYSGGTTIGSGTFALVGSASLFSTATITIQGSATFDLSQGLSTQTIGSLSSTSSTAVVNLGGNTLVLGSDPTYPSTSFAGILSGGGGTLVKVGSGTFTLSGSSSYSGGTYIKEGTISLVSNQSPDLGIFYLENGKLELPNGGFSSGNIVLVKAGTISVPFGSTLLEGEVKGGGDLTTKGNLIIAGVWEYTGTITVSTGTLTVDGSVTKSQDPIVLSGARLNGCGTVSETIVYGVLGGGNGKVPGRLTVEGFLQMKPGSEIEVLHTSQGTSTVKVLEEAEIQQAGVYLTVRRGVDLMALKPIRFLEVNGEILGTGFSSIRSNSPYLTGEIVQEKGGFLLLPRRKKLSSLANDPNAKAVGHVLQQAFYAKDEALLSVIQGLFDHVLEERDVERALVQLQPALLKGGTISQENNAVKVQDALLHRMQNQCVGQPETFYAWINGFEDLLHQNSLSYVGRNQIGYQTKTGGVVTALETRIRSSFLVGILGAYTGSSLHFAENRGKEAIDTGYAGLYAAAQGGVFHGSLSCLGGWSHFQGNRNIFYPGMRALAISSHGGTQLLSHLDMGIHWQKRNFSLCPFDSFDYISQRENGFQESNAGVLNLKVNPSNAIMIRNELGMKWRWGFSSKECPVLMISPKLSWVREVRVKGGHYQACFARSMQEVFFTVAGYFPSRSLFSPGLLVSGAWFKELLTCSLYFDGEFGQKYSDYTYGGQVRVQF